MTYEYKSKALQQLAAKNAQKTQTTVMAILLEMQRAREKVEILNGERGSNRAVRQSDVKGAVNYKLKSRQLSDDDALGKSAYNALQADVAALFALLAQIAKT